MRSHPCLLCIVHCVAFTQECSRSNCTFAPHASVCARERVFCKANISNLIYQQIVYAAAGNSQSSHVW